MNLQMILAAIVVLAILLMPAAWIVSFIRKPYRALHVDKPTASLGNALQELDRITRPSVEHVAEIEEQVRKRDDVGGE
jgi:hypothetical protein